MSDISGALTSTAVDRMTAGDAVDNIVDVTSLSKDGPEDGMNETSLSASSSAELFQKLMASYPDSSADAIEHAKIEAVDGQKRSDLVGHALDSINDITDQWKNIMHALGSNPTKTISLREVMRTQMVLAEASFAGDLVGKFVGKSVQNLETLLRMQ